MIIPGILASRVKDQGPGWLLRSTSVLAVSRNTRLETDGFMKAASVMFVRRMLAENHMARARVMAASVRFVRRQTRIMPMPYLKSADVAVVTKHPREIPIIVIKGVATALLVSKQLPGAPNPVVRTMSVLVVSKMEEAA